MKLIELRDHIDGRFSQLESRINDLERTRAYMTGVWKALTVVGVVGVSVLGIVIKTKLF